MKPDVAVVVSQLVTGYRGQGHDTVVSGPFSAELHSGELTCLLGPNGAESLRCCARCRPSRRRYVATYPLWDARLIPIPKQNWPR